MASLIATSTISVPARRSSRGERVIALEQAGRWDEAVVLSTALLATADLSPFDRARHCQVLGVIRAKRGEPGAWEYLDEAAAAADTSGEPQAIIAVRLARAEAHWLQGEPHRAQRRPNWPMTWPAASDEWDRGEIGAWLRRTGSSRPPRGELAKPYRLVVVGEWEEASRLWTELGCPYEAALALHDSNEETALRRR